MRSRFMIWTSSRIPWPVAVSRTSTTRRSSDTRTPGDEPALLHPVDETGRVGQGHVEVVREPAHRQLARLLEPPHDVEMRHADALLHHPAGRGAAEEAHRTVQLVEDARDGGRSAVAGSAAPSAVRGSGVVAGRASSPAPSK